jgi:chemotaxis protein CheX
MTDGPLVLAEALDMRAAGPLLEAVRSRRGAPLALDGSQVERLGGQCLQVILAAHAAWAADGHGFEICNPSTALKEGWALMGAEPLPASFLEFAQ